ncbi:MAG: MaoC family dehydratase [Burkholderiales bacterium]|nr:MAG: MaoC family dehydratase [Burkholderiales bacterium]
MPTLFKERYFEDYAVGDSAEFGAMPVDADEIVAFAERYDPQPFHVDPDAAARSPFGGLIASGWMTAGIMMRMLCDHFLSERASLGSPGVEELRWVRPVRPGDTLQMRATIEATRRSRSKPDRGLLWLRYEVTNQSGEVVMTCRAMALLRCRDGAPAT